MFLPFLAALRRVGVPVSLREYLGFLEAVRVGLANQEVETFYHLARATMVKDERHLDRFDRAFAEAFEGLGEISPEAVLAAIDLPRDWLERILERRLSPAEMAEVEAMGGFERLMETLKQRLAEQKGRHQGGSKWIGTAGTSPFGAHGYNPEGVRIGQDASRHRRAVKVWDRREFRDLDDRVEIGTRAIKLALRRLRRWAREGAAEELDLGATVRATAEQGWLDVRTRPERHNAVKVLLFLDVGGSMDDHVRLVEELFSAARSEFRHLEQFNFHNCPYEGLWRDNRRRHEAPIPTAEVIRRFGPDHKAIFVGDATMSPYEISHPGGAIEHWNAEAGAVWLRRLCEQWPGHVWLNPVPEAQWPHSPSVAMIAGIFGGAMHPLTLAGLGAAIDAL